MPFVTFTDSRTNDRLCNADVPFLPRKGDVVHLTIYRANTPYHGIVHRVTHELHTPLGVCITVELDNLETT